MLPIGSALAIPDRPPAAEIPAAIPVARPARAQGVGACAPRPHVATPVGRQPLRPARPFGIGVFVDTYA